MRLFKTRWIARFTRRERIADVALREAIDRAERGLIDADLGGGLIKQRVARPNEGRRGGYRMMVAYKARERAVFLFGFAKSDLDNIRDEQLAELRMAGQFVLSADAAALASELKSGSLLEVENDQENQGRER